MRPSRLVLFMATAALLPACAATQMTPAEQEMVQTMGAEAFQPATREARDNIETQDLLTQASFWSREHRLNPSDLEASIKLASVVRRMGNPQRAIEITQATRALHPKDPYLLAEHAAAMVAVERGPDALPLIERGLSEASGYARLWSLRGAALDQMERYAEARVSYERALAITPYDPNILGNMGLSYALQGDYATAKGWLEKAVAIPGASEGIQRNLDLVRDLSGQSPAPASSAAPRRAPATAPTMSTVSAGAPQRRMQIMSSESGMSASDAARQMAARQAPLQTVPLKASDPNALARLARNAAGHSAPRQLPVRTAPVQTSQSNPQTVSPFAPRPQVAAPGQTNPQIVPQAYTPAPPQGYPQAYPQGMVAYPQGVPPTPQPSTQQSPHVKTHPTPYGQVLPRGPARTRR